MSGVEKLVAAQAADSAVMVVRPHNALAELTLV
jgi:hypothetical protein